MDNRFISKKTAILLLVLILLGSWVIFRLKTSEPTVLTLQPPNRTAYPAEAPAETSLGRMPAPETSPGWVLFDSNASGQLSQNTHFAFEHPAGWYKESYANDAYAITIAADYNLAKKVPNPDRPSEQMQYIPKEYCRVIVKSSAEVPAPEVSYQNTYITPELVAACTQILEKAKKTFWYDFK